MKLFTLTVRLLDLSGLRSVFLILAFFFCFFQAGIAAPLEPYITEDFKLFWNNPVRAHPGIPLDFSFSIYEINNENLFWEITNAPTGMTIDQTGTIQWTPAPGDVGIYPDIHVNVMRESGDSIDRYFTLTVGTDDFIFVSPTGSDDTGDGSEGSPYATLDHTFDQLVSGEGKSIYIREGTYNEYWNNSSMQYLDFSATDPLEIRNYPNERVIIDCQYLGFGPYFFHTSFVILNGIEVTRGTSVANRANVVVQNSDHVIFKNIVSSDFHAGNGVNPSGFLVQASIDILLDHTIAFGNGDPAQASPAWNSANFLFYTENTPAGDIYVLNSKAYDSIVGFKIKHAGPKRLIIHNCEAFDHEYGFAVGSAYSSMRYSVSYNNLTGFVLGMADLDYPYTDPSVIMEQNTIVNSAYYGSHVFHLYVRDNPVIRNNIIFNDLQAAGTGESDDRLMAFWLYDSDAETYPMDSVYNVFFGLSENNIIRLGNLVDRNYSFTEWQTSKGEDPNSVFADPLFVDHFNGDVSIPFDSPANFGSGDYVGAFKPGVSYPVAGEVYEYTPPGSSPTAILTAFPGTISEDESSTLTWCSTSATSCTGTNFATGGATSGSVSVSPTEDTTYTVDCNGATDSATVTPAVPGNSHRLQVGITGKGGGSVFSSRKGINCPGDCNQLYSPGTTVTLTAVPDERSVFKIWSGDCAGSLPTCTVTMNDAKDISALFHYFPWTLFLPAIENGQQ